MDTNSKIGSNVHLGKNAQIDSWVTLGVEKKELKTTIGSECHIRSHSVIYGGNIIGDEFQTGHGVLIRENNRIGNMVSIGSHSVIEHHVTIGNGVRIHTNSFVPEYSVLEDDCWLGPHVVLTNSKYPKSPESKQSLKGPLIKAGAIIGANATILPGVTVGKKAVIGAGAVITSNVEDFAVMVGNPGKRINTRMKLPYV